MSDMAKLIAEIPHVVSIKRKGYRDVYFKVHVKDRPDGWTPSIPLGRTDKLSMAEIAKRAEETYSQFMAFKDKFITGEDISRKMGTLPDVITIYRSSSFWKDLADRTRKDYDTYLELIEKWSKRNGHPPLKNMTKPHAIKWLNTMEGTPVKQRRAKTVLSILFSIAEMEGYVPSNIVKGIKLRKRQTEKRAVTLWAEDHIDRFIEKADAMGLASIGSIVLTGIETAQRRGDVVKMVNGKDYKDGKLRYYQSKTKKHVWFDATDKLKERLKLHKDSFYLFTNSHGKKWHSDTVTHHVREICDLIEMPDHILGQLRHSQINYLYELGLDDQTIIAMTGHERPQTMRQFYREKRNEKLANQGIAYINKERKKRKGITK